MGIFRHDGHAVSSVERMVQLEMDGRLLESVMESVSGHLKAVCIVIVTFVWGYS